MDNFFLYGSGQQPDIIIGKYGAAGLNPEISNVYASTDIFQTLSTSRVNKYELWFSTTINFIPYDGSPVFVADTQGNITHDGNLLTKKDLTVNGNTVVKGDLVVNNNVNVDKNVNISQNLSVDADITTNRNLTINKDLYVSGKIISVALNGFITSTEKSLEDIKKTADGVEEKIKKLDELEDIKKQIKSLEDNIKKLEAAAEDKKTSE